MLFKQSTYPSPGTKIFQLQRLITAILFILVISSLYWQRHPIINHFRKRPIDINGLPRFPKNLPRARQIAGKEFLNQHQPNFSTNTIPRIIHQSWESVNIPSKWQTWSDSWRVKNPDWEWVLWTNEDNRALVAEYAPWFLQTYDALPGEISRADVMRNFYMFFFGGVYADLDVECLRSHDTLIEKYHTSFNIDSSSSKSKHVALFGRMGSDTKSRDSIPNAWMASSPGHPFFWLPVSYVSDHSRESKVSIESLTGPIALRRQINVYKQNSPAAVSLQVQQSPLGTVYHDTDVPVEHQVIVLNETLIYPYSWAKDGRAVKYVCEFNEFDFDPRQCQELLRTAEHESYAITYWSHSWTRTGHNIDHLENAT